jgi:hypothetical protein
MNYAPGNSPPATADQFGLDSDRVDIHRDAKKRIKRFEWDLGQMAQLQLTECGESRIASSPVSHTGKIGRKINIHQLR